MSRWCEEPDALEALAAGWRRAATGLRDDHARLVRQLAELAWDGAAAEALRRAVGRDLTRLSDAADLVDTASATLSAHAADVREVTARIRAAEAASLAWFSRAEHWVVAR